MSEYPFLNAPYAFTVCRIEPENNLHLILEAFAPPPPLTLVIVGNWNNSEYGRELRRRHGRQSGVFLLDPIYDPEQLNLLRQLRRLSARSLLRRHQSVIGGSDVPGIAGHRLRREFQPGNH